MDIRTGTIMEAEKVAKTKKLLKLKIDTGLDQRTVVSGIAEFFEPEAIVGRQVSILVNLAPRNIKGDRKSTRLNSSHVRISYAVFCLKKKMNILTCGRH